MAWKSSSYRHHHIKTHDNHDFSNLSFKLANAKHSFIERLINEGSILSGHCICLGEVYISLVIE